MNFIIFKSQQSKIHFNLCYFRQFFPFWLNLVHLLTDYFPFFKIFLIALMLNVHHVVRKVIFGNIINQKINRFINNIILSLQEFINLFR